MQLYTDSSGYLAFYGRKSAKFATNQGRFLHIRTKPYIFEAIEFLGLLLLGERKCVCHRTSGSYEARKFRLWGGFAVGHVVELKVY